MGKSYIRGKCFFSITFQTRQLECFNEIFNLFYFTRLWRVKGKNFKYINPELFYYMNYRVLAFLIMGDGSKKNKGLEISTQSYSLKEVIYLADILRIKFDLNPGIHVSRPDKSIYTKKSTSYSSVNYKIFINSKDLNKIRPFILPFFVKDFLYKIN